MMGVDNRRNGVQNQTLITISLAFIKAVDDNQERRSRWHILVVNLVPAKWLNDQFLQLTIRGFVDDAWIIHYSGSNDMSKVRYGCGNLECNRSPQSLYSVTTRVPARKKEAGSKFTAR
jgi:hypothetical protein